MGWGEGGGGAGGGGGGGGGVWAGGPPLVPFSPPPPLPQRDLVAPTLRRLDRPDGAACNWIALSMGLGIFLEDFFTSLAMA